MRPSDQPGTPILIATRVNLIAVLMLSATILLGCFASSALATVTAVTAGESHSCAIDDGAAKCWGRNNRGQLGNGTSSSAPAVAPVQVQGLEAGVTAISAGSDHTCAIVGGGLKCWGANDQGQLGAGIEEDGFEPFPFFLSEVPLPVEGMTSGVTSVATGWGWTCAVVSGAAKCWGDNVFSTIGSGWPCVDYCVAALPEQVVGLTSNTTQVAAGYFHSCAIVTEAVKCWGWTELLGSRSTGGFVSSAPVDVDGLDSGVSSISVGNRHSCAIQGGALKCWAQDTSAETILGLDSDVELASAGASFTCAVKSGAAVCFGVNEHGQLGNGSTSSSSSPVAVTGLGSSVTSIASGLDHACAVIAGEAKCWGANDHGQLGDLTTTGSTTPVNVTGLAGDPPSATPQIATATSHTCAVTASLALKCWGGNARGQLGNGTTVDSRIPVAVSGLSGASGELGATAVALGYQHSCALTSAGGVKCWGFASTGALGIAGAFSSSTPRDVVGLSSGVTAIAVGDRHSCALTSAGGVKCWGYNVYGQLGDDSQVNRLTPVDVSGLTSGVVAISAGYSHTCALLSSGGVTCWGRNNSGQLGDSTKIHRKSPVAVQGLGADGVSIAVGGHHSCVVVVGGALKCWGSGRYGQLGRASTASATTAIPVSALSSGVVRVSAGVFHSCAVRDDGSSVCWGSNRFGQLGTGDLVQRHVPTAVIGFETAGAASLAGGADHSCVLTTAGTAKCWGLNSSGQLGINSIVSQLTPADVLGL